MSGAPQNVPAEIQSFCEHCSRQLRDLTDPQSCIKFTRRELPRLLHNKELFIKLLRDATSGGEFPDVRRPTMFDNELILYLDSDRIFSLRMYLWGPGEYTSAHDHNSWGVIGTVNDGYEVINYQREDNGSIEGYAKLTEVQRFHLKAGDTAYTLPFDDGIHMTGNPTQQTLITLNMYGRSLPRSYLCGFDVVNNRVYRILPPRRKKEYLMGEALKSLQRGNGF